MGPGQEWQDCNPCWNLVLLRKLHLEQQSVQPTATAATGIVPGATNGLQQWQRAVFYAPWNGHGCDSDFLSSADWSRGPRYCCVTGAVSGSHNRRRTSGE